MFIQKKLTSKKRETPDDDEGLVTTPTIPRHAKNYTSRKRKRPAVSDSSVPTPPQIPRRDERWGRCLNDQEIYEYLVTESDDNYSDFDDDVGDHDFDLESNPNTESKQSKDEENQVVNPQVRDDPLEVINTTNKPIMITDYNKTKGGVDEVDKKCSNYSCSRRIQRWPMVLFYRLIDLSGVNTVLYNKCINKVNMKRGPFLFLLARELVLPEMKLRVYNDRMPRELQLTMERVIGPTDMPEPPPPKNITPDPVIRKTCAICPVRTKYFCYQCKQPMCFNCCHQVRSDCKIRQ